MKWIAKLRKMIANTGIACSFGYHEWQLPTETTMLRSKVGLLAGVISTGTQRCANCPQYREAYRASTPMRLCTDDTGWRPLTPETKSVIDQGFIPV
jgi:hypothetical protein